MTSDADLGWLAGIIDGEGTINLGWNQGSPWVRVRIPSTTEAIIAKAERTMTDLGVRSLRSVRPGVNFPLVLIEATGRRAFDLLRHLEPHLVRQDDRARAVLAFFGPLYADQTARGAARKTVIWTKQLRTDWETVRTVYNRKAM